VRIAELERRQLPPDVPLIEWERTVGELTARVIASLVRGMIDQVADREMRPQTKIRGGEAIARSTRRNFPVRLRSTSRP
jgi:hypothetical protein